MKPGEIEDRIRAEGRRASLEAEARLPGAEALLARARAEASGTVPATQPLLETPPHVESLPLPGPSRPPITLSGWLSAGRSPLTPLLWAERAAAVVGMSCSLVVLTWLGALAVGPYLAAAEFQRWIPRVLGSEFEGAVLGGSALGGAAASAVGSATVSLLLGGAAVLVAFLYGASALSSPWGRGP